MRDLIEGYLARAGTPRTVMLLGTSVLWAVTALAIAVYAVLKGIWTFGTLTWAAADGGVADIIIAIVLWIFLGLSVVLARAARELWLEHRDQRWSAERALNDLEERLFPGQSTAYLETLRDRLATRALEDMETKILGTPRSAEHAIEERLIELQAAASAPDSGDDSN